MTPPAQPEAPPASASDGDPLARVRPGMERLRAAVGQSFLGHTEAVELLLYAVLAEGHVLLEGAPGLGKTTLVRSLASALDLPFRRVQFTPDLMPADIVGSRLLEEDAEGRRHFTFQRGPIFTQLLLADEINRATPRTQSALLEAMQERQVTVFGDTLKMERPFTVVATQNPIEMEGTYPLPEAQLDRFIAKIDLTSPGEAELLAILRSTTGARAAEQAPCMQRAELLEMCDLVRQVPASSDIERLVARLVLRTDPHRKEAPEEVRRYLRYGSSPRGGQAVLLLAKARALSKGRLHVASEDVEAVARPALRHRLILGYEGEADGVRPDELIGRALAAASA